MHDRIDHDLGFFQPINDRVRKAIAVTSSGAMSMTRPRVWKVYDAADRFVDLVKKVLSETEFPIVVEVLCRHKLTFRLWMKGERHFL